MCEHKRLRCTDNVFYCLDCGAKVEPKPADEPKPKRKRRKDDEDGQVS